MQTIKCKCCGKDIQTENEAANEHVGKYIADLNEDAAVCDECKQSGETRVRYAVAQKLLNDNKYVQAYKAFTALGEYRDSAQNAQYAKALKYLGDRRFADAALIFANLGEFRDCPQYLAPYKVLLLTKANVGDVVSFGTYDQDINKPGHKQPIWWVVLAVHAGKIFLITEDCIDRIAYNNRYTATLWQDSSLRRWLNGTFINSAFSAEEKKAISTEKLINIGRSTEDKVFVLNLSEAERYYFSNNEDRVAECTSIAQARGGTGEWWLRSAGTETASEATVDAEGNVNKAGKPVNSMEVTVRPAMWVNLESKLFTSAMQMHPLYVKRESGVEAPSAASKASDDDERSAKKEKALQEKQRKAEEKAKAEAAKLAEKERKAAEKAAEKERAEAQKKALADKKAEEKAKALEEAKIKKEREAIEKQLAAEAAEEAKKAAEAAKLAEKERKEAEAKAKAEAEAKAKAEAEAKAKAEAEAKAKAEAEAKARAEAEERLRKEKEELEMRIAAERKAAEEAEQRAEKERREREERERRAEEARKELERAKAEAAAQAEKERLAREELERKAKEEKARAEAARLAAEERIRKEREEREAAERAEAEAKAEAERIRRETEERARKEREEREAAERRMAEQRKAEEAALKAAEEKARKEKEELEKRERDAKAEAARVLREAEEKARKAEAERQAELIKQLKEEKKEKEKKEKQRAEEEKKRATIAKIAAAKSKRRMKVLKGIIVALVCIIIIGVLAAAGAYWFWYRDVFAYEKATELYDSGSYIEAAEAFEALGDYSDSEQMYRNCTKMILKTAKEGDVIPFGKYTLQGEEKTAIYWKAVKADGGKLLLVASQNIEVKSFHMSTEAPSWDISSLREWLNGDFINGSFTAEEAAYIAERELEEADKSSTSTQTEKAFILSAAEAKTYFKTADERKGLNSSYLVSQYHASSRYWLRTVLENGNIAYVDGAGKVEETEGLAPTTADVAVRPAIWVDIPEN